jgi:hypothetical protein
MGRDIPPPRREDTYLLWRSAVRVSTDADSERETAAVLNAAESRLHHGTGLEVR